MKIKLLEFNLMVKSLEAAKIKEIETVYFRIAEIADHRNFEYTHNYLEHLTWCALHDDDIEEFRPYDLRKLLQTMKLIQSGKIELQDYLLKDSISGCLLVNLENIYILNQYPKLLTEEMKNFDWTHIKLKGKIRGNLLELGVVLYFSFELSDVPQGLAIVQQLWSEYAPSEITDRPSFLDAPISEHPRIIKKAHYADELKNEQRKMKL